VRIVAGRLRSRALEAPKGDATRPTSDRVRESLFAVLGDLTGARVLDVYAGSGALGIEAVSRGASRSVLVEAARPALAVIGKNVAALGLGAEVRVIARRVGQALASVREHAPFDLVLADPPYADVPSGALARELGPLLRAEGVLAEDARVVVEHAARDAPPALEGLAIVDERRWGDTRVTIYARVTGAAHAEPENGAGRADGEEGA
jgi:16S rRNA (guanine(966)-N(2))-methyltransferase RsmD